MRILVAAVIALLSLSHAVAETERLQMLEVISSGFTGPGKKVELGRIRRAVSRTPGVTAEPGTAFVMTVRPVGEPKGSEVSLRWVWKAPRPGVKDKDSGKLVRQVSEETTAVIGSETERRWEFKEASDIVRGNWRVEVWNGKRRLAVRRFAVK